jgi:hypothetical protein
MTAKKATTKATADSFGNDKQNGKVQPQRQKQIPFGNDNKKSDDKGNSIDCAYTCLV